MNVTRCQQLNLSKEENLSSNVSGKKRKPTPQMDINTMFITSPNNLASKEKAKQRMLAAFCLYVDIISTKKLNFISFLF